MKRSTLLFTMLLCCASAASSDTPKRPRILGIAYVRIHSTNFGSSSSFFSKELGFRGAVYCKDKNLVCLAVNERQLVQLDSAATPLRGSFVEEIGLATPDVSAMRRYLVGVGLKPTRIESQEGSQTTPTVSILRVPDPEAHTVAFVQGQTGAYYLDYDPRISTAIIHAGFVVHDRAATDHFYRDILGFRPYWHGGMKDDKDDWVAMQVPDGTDWVEYMLNVPADADRRLLGVMNHIALGVPNIQSAKAQLLKNRATLAEEPQMGRDGKWQLNLYDPDLTRVEFMEFTPVQKPCCSEFTGPHPGPQPPSKAPAKP